MEAVLIAPCCSEMGIHETPERQRLPPLNTAQQVQQRPKTQELGRPDVKILSTSSRPIPFIHWDDSIRRLHLNQHEERHKILNLAVQTLQEKQAEWAGVFVHPEASLELERLLESRNRRRGRCIVCVFAGR
jgi:hypothetical protein